MSLLKKIIQIIYTVYAIILFGAFLLIIFPLVVIISFAGKIEGGNILYRLCSYWADAWLFLVGIYVKRIYEARPDKKKQYIFVANHISNMDVPMFVKVIRQPVRALGKFEMSKIPVFGFLYRKTVVMVDRSSADNRARSVMVLKSVVRKGISVFVFPEGTFNTTGRPLKEFYDGAFRIAIETQTPVKPVVFLDTLERLHHKSVFSLTPGKSRAVFLKEVSVEGLTVKDVQVLKQNVFKMMEDALRKYKL
jgi:1-acyl-sn-glycerol-3-phosphate acyltransferase